MLIISFRAALLKAHRMFNEHARAVSNDLTLFNFLERDNQPALSSLNSSLSSAQISPRNNPS